jgi:hypothetical protein
VAAKPDVSVPIALMCIGIAIAMPRILQDGPLVGNDRIYATAGLMVAAAVGIRLVVALFRRSAKWYHQ